MSDSEAFVRADPARGWERRGLARAGSVLVLGAALAACSGGGGGGSALSLGFQSSTGSAGEGASASVLVELRTTGGPLASDVSATVADAGTGTATPGSDYQALAPVTVTFPAGSVNGDTVAVPLTLLDDSVVEGADETVVLSLSNASQGVAIRQGGRYTLSITEDDLATLDFSVGTEKTPDESDATYTVDVTLTLGAGVTLGVDASATVRDAGTGTATSGTDYDAFATSQVTFPAGSASGDSRTYSITVVDDTVAELDETVVLELTGATPGTRLGATPEFVLSITEDDASPDPFLIAMGEDVPGGTLQTLASGDTRDLGSGVLDGGPGTPLRIELSNAGLTPMTLSPLALSGDTRDFRIEADLGALPPGSGGLLPPAGSVPLHPSTASPPVGQAWSFDAARAQELATGGASVRLDGLVDPSGNALTLALGRRPLPLAADAVLMVDGSPVAGGMAAALDGLSIWTGTVEGEPGSEVFLGFSPVLGATGWIRHDEAHGREILDLVPTRDGSLAVLAREEDLEALSSTGGPSPCQGELLPPDRLLPPGAPGTGSTISTGLSLETARLAIETDYQYFQLFGDATAAATYATEMIAAVADVYERDVQATLSIAYLGIYTTSNDPWTSPDGGSDTLDLLNEFQNRWTTDGWPAPADVAHFLSGANLGGGIAYVGVLCNQVYAFGVSANLSGNIDWGTWAGAAGPATFDFVVVAHELGHNFGASHTHDYCPPLDECYTNCNGTTRCQRSTLMSYCHLCGAGLSNIDLRFHPYNADVMRDEIATSCLGDATLSPGGTLAFDVSFDPTSGTGGKAVTLTFDHDAVNAPSPFALGFSATSTN